VSINDYFTGGVPPVKESGMPPLVLAALIILPILGITGTALVYLSVTKNRPPPSLAIEPPPQTSPQPQPVPQPVTTAATATDEPAASAAPDEPSEPESPPATSMTATATVTAHPRPTITAGTATAAAKPASSSGKKCHIVAKPDSSGRMKFEEVCSP
jgi:hypothetical protein